MNLIGKFKEKRRTMKESRTFLGLIGNFLMIYDDAEYTGFDRLFSTGTQRIDKISPWSRRKTGHFTPDEK
jgi:hypothetical protein